jgi:hypothetical protein
MRRISVLAIAFVVIGVVIAADPSPSAKLYMIDPGKVLIADDFASGPSKDWRAGKGKWDAVDGGVKATQVAADMHAATLRRPISFRNGVIEYKFRFDAGKLHTLSLNDPKGHVCRVKVTPTGFVVQKDDHDKKDGPDKAEVLGTCDMTLKPGEWYTITVEFNGAEMLARIGDKAAYGKSTAIDVDKSNVGLTVAGDGVTFKDFRAWTGMPAKDWEKNRARFAK